MKKLLSLLSVLTISGTAVPTTIAASPYQKEKLNSDINYKQTNNLETLNRSKRQNNNQNIVGISEVVITTNGSITSSSTVLNNKIYFGSHDNKVYEYNTETKKQKIVITADYSINLFNFSGIILNNKIYFGAENSEKVYEYNPVTEQQKALIIGRYLINVSGVVLNNKLYIGSRFGDIYEYDSMTSQQKVILENKKIISGSVLIIKFILVLMITRYMNIIL